MNNLPFKINNNQNSEQKSALISIISFVCLVLASSFAIFCGHLIQLKNLQNKKVLYFCVLFMFFRILVAHSCTEELFVFFFFAVAQYRER
jgi:hypothetical protein